MKYLKVMENNKYYTPTIEEFHVGFEYTKKELIDKGHNNTKLFINEDLIKSHFTTDDIRVKYLDKEDIESLGWEFTGKTIDIWFKKEGIFHAISGGHKFTEYKLHYGLHDHCLYINAYFGGTDEGRLFEGIIKNKSELKRLMKQLGIND